MGAEFWIPLAGSLLGVLIGALIAMGTMLLGKRVDRRDKHWFILVEAYADWSRALEETLSHHQNFYELIAQKGTFEDDPAGKQLWKAESVRVSSVAGDAGRRLDSARYRILLLEARPKHRKRVSEITENSMMKELVGTPIGDVSIFTEKASEIRDQLIQFLQTIVPSDT